MLCTAGYKETYSNAVVTSLHIKM